MKYRRISMLLLIITGNLKVDSQDFNFEWSQTFNKSYYSSGNIIEIDPEGNVITAGFFVDSLFFESDTIVPTKTYSYFIIKKSESGEIIWFKLIESDNYFRIFSSTLDENNNIYLSGYFAGIWQYNEIDIESVSDYDCFLLSISKDGNYRWIKSAGGNGPDYQWFVESDGKGGIYTTGKHYYENFLFDNGTILDNYGPYIAKYDCSGNFQWAKNIGSDFVSTCVRPIIDSSEIIIPGSIYGNFYLDTLVFSDNLAASIVFLNLDGTYKDIKLFGANQGNSSLIHSLIKDNEDNYYFFLYNEGEITIDDTTLNSLGENNYLLLKFNNEWKREWIKEINSTGVINGNGIYRLELIEEKIFLAIGGDSIMQIGDTLIEPIIHDAYVFCFHTSTGEIEHLIRGFSTWNVEINDLKVQLMDGYIYLFFIGNFADVVTFPGFESYAFASDTYYAIKYSLSVPEIPDTLFYIDNFLLYPNPTEGFINLKFKEIQPENLILNLFDINGKLLFNQLFHCQDTKIIEDIDISNNQNGIYFLKIQYDKKFVQRKLILVK